MEEKSRQTKGREVQHEWRSPALLENHKQTDEQIDQTNQVDVKIAGCPIRDCSQVIQICVIGSRLDRIRRTLDQVMNLAAHVSLVQIDLNVPGINYLFAFLAAGDFFASITSHADGQQAIAGNHLRSSGSRIWFNSPGDYALGRVNPGDSIPRRWEMTEALGKVHRSGSNQQGRRDKQQPCFAG